MELKVTSLFFNAEGRVYRIPRIPNARCHCAGFFRTTKVGTAAHSAKVISFFLLEGEREIWRYI